MKRGRPRSFDRDAALDEAVRLFWERGFEATSVRDLTDRLGIEAPSLYRAFGDKRTLFAEVVRCYEDEYGGFMRRALAEEASARDAALRMLREAPARYTRPGLPTGCLVAGGDAGATDPAIVAELSGIRKANVQALAERIRDDVAAGLLPGELDAVALARYTMWSLNALAAAARDGLGTGDLTAIAAVAARAWP